ncbi:hypothetical protein C8R43DRAFT_1118590 [Mycena crocata]|nr:hypothetical protein C8R43DRAFT_1118590 [Mycena crocata]
MQAAPVEIIRRIFELSMPSRDESVANGRISFLDSPWSLTLVSPLWRAIALSTPSLWSSIVIAIEPSTPSWVNYPIALLNLQISRSRPHPVQVVFISKELPGYTTAKLFDVIVQCCSRWETLEIDSSQPLSQISLSRLRGHLPSLREMTVRFSSSDGQLGTNFFEFAPQLRVARIIDPETVSCLTRV